jgi:Tfp pilus assembly protein PilV
MDKALEIIMVAVILIVASVVVIALLQGQTENFGNYSREQTQGSSCGLAAQRLATSMDCNDPNPQSTIPTGAGTIYNKNNPECWSSKSAAENRAC